MSRFRFIFLIAIVAGGCTKKLPVDWDTCESSLRVSNGNVACRMYQIPSDNEARNIYVKRLTPDEPVERQVWLLMGGVGEPGTSALNPLMDLLHRMLPQAEIFTLDTYGTGNSDYLGCPASQQRSTESGTLVSTNEVAACVDELDLSDPQVYGVSRDADDLAWLITHHRRTDIPVLVWGGSAGSLLAQRLLVHYSSAVDGVVLEGVHVPALPLLRHQQFCDNVGNGILSLCASDETCATKLPNPSETLDTLYTSIESGHCSELNLDRVQVAETLKSLLYYSPLHAAIPAFIYRLQRCTEADVKVLTPFIVRAPNGVDAASVGQPKFYLWVCNESYWQPEVEGEQVSDFLEQVSGQTRFAGNWAQEMKTWCDELPSYSDDTAATFPSTDVPMLIMQGGLDPATPVAYARQWASHVSGDHQHYVEFPYGAHNITLGTPYINGAEASDCGLELLVNFMMSPSGQLDKSCVNETLSPDFSGERFAAQHLGIEDLWD